MSEEHTPRYSQCVLCGFYLPTDKYKNEDSLRPLHEQPSCPNCGIVDPTNHSFWKQAGYEKGGGSTVGNLAAAAVVGGVAGGLAAGAVSLFGGGASALGGILPWTVGLLTAGTCGWAGVVNSRQSRYRRRDCFQQIEANLREELEPPQSLRETEEQLTQRIASLRQQGQDATALENALATVREALAVASERASRVRLIPARIAMIRWQNQLEPLLLDPPLAAGVDEWKRRLQRLREIRPEGQALATRLAEQTDLVALPEGARLQRSWSELLAGCERLENELLARQAVAAVAESRPSPKAALEAERAEWDVTAEQALRHTLITEDFGDLDTAVTDLRAQQARLHAERELSEQTVATVGRAG